PDLAPLPSRAQPPMSQAQASVEA
ncbi:hypothetical protein A2U01_0066775, partial [Trifolium medium]|nr:hypothetical protein [Trifolium medium]